MNIAIRVDASSEMGSGHLMRCAALAGVLKRGGDEVTFICRELHGHYCDWLKNEGYRVLRLGRPNPSERVDDRLAHSSWLGVTQKKDGEETRKALDGGIYDWLVVDHYGLDREWEASLRNLARRVLAIDDLADRPHDADVLLDQNLQTRRGRYDGLVASACCQLIGPHYALLRGEFAERRVHLGMRTGHLGRLLVFMGGSDPRNLTSVVLSGVCLSAVPLRVDVVIGDGAPHLSALRNQCAELANCFLHVQTSAMANLIAESDLAIGAPGSASWERCCLGLPTLLIPFADNQREVADALAHRRAAIVLGGTKPVSAESIGAMLGSLARRSSLLRRLGRRALEITDGLGARRLRSIMSSFA